MTPDPKRHPSANPAERATSQAAFEQAFELDHAPDKVWAALTKGRLLARWLLPCDLDAGGGGVEPGAAFSFTMPRTEGEEGRIDCEVVELEPGRRLSLTWRTHRDQDPRPAEAVDTLVTFELDVTPRGRTRLRVRQVGHSAETLGATVMLRSARGGPLPRRVPAAHAAAGLALAA